MTRLDARRVAADDRPHRLHPGRWASASSSCRSHRHLRHAARRASRTEGTGLFSLMRNIGSSVGISIVISLLSATPRSITPRSAPRHRRSTRAVDLPTVDEYWNVWTAGRPRRAECRGHRAGRDHRLCRRLPADDVPVPGSTADAAADAPLGQPGRRCGSPRRRAGLRPPVRGVTWTDGQGVGFMPAPCRPSPGSRTSG